jgi:hypothetical protein
LPDDVAVGFDFDHTIVELIGDQDVPFLVEIVIITCPEPINTQTRQERQNGPKSDRR